MKLITPEGFSFPLPLAGVARRTLAWILDECVIVGSLNFIFQILHAVRLVLPGFASAAGAITSAIASVLYFAALEWLWHGQTIGKRALGLRVMDAHGLTLDGYQVLFRNLMRMVDFLPAVYLTGAATVLATRRSQRLGDMVAGTVVARRPEPIRETQRWEGPAKYNSLLEDRALALRLRERTTPEEGSLVRETLERGERLAPSDRAALFQQLTDHFDDRVRFPAGLRATLADEQILRGIWQVLQAPRLKL